VIDSDPRKQRLHNSQSFDDFYGLWRQDIERIAMAYRYRFTSGWSGDPFTESYSAVNMIWWESVLHWKPTLGSFGVFFWSNWKNYMATVYRRNSARKRPEVVVTYEDIALLTQEHIDPEYWGLLYTDDPQEHLVIGMLAAGYRPKEVCDVVGRRTYYRITNEWKTHYMKERTQ
jgi:CubicO group peptidase (beta-lactamase class C family)